MNPPTQLVLPLLPEEPPTLDNFLVGDNRELLAILHRLGEPPSAELPAALTIWGAGGVGKTHLLTALTQHWQDHALLVNAHNLPSSPFVEARLLLVDTGPALDEASQGWLFTAFNHVVGRGGRVVVSLPLPPLACPLRPDLRSRLGSGLVLEVRPLPQDELPTLFRQYCAERGLRVSDEVLAYVLGRQRRDIRTIRATLAAIDRLSLEWQRPVTLPLVRAALADLSQG